MLNRVDSKRLWCMMFALPLAAVSLAGCGDDSSTEANPPVSSGPLYVVSSLVFSPDFSSSTGTVRLASSLEAGSELDDSTAIEVGSSPVTGGLDNKGEFFSIDTDNGTVTKFFLDEAGALQKGSTLNFSAYGITSFVYPVMVVSSETRAYLWDNITLQAFVIDPSTMTIVDPVDMKDQFDPVEGETEYPPFMENDPIQVGSKLYMAFNYWDRASFGVLPRSGMFIIDTATDTMSIAKHPTCGGLMASMLASDGYIYSGSAGHQAAGWIAGLTVNTAPCLARFDPKKDAFDETFKVDLTTLSGGAGVSGIVPSSGNYGYVRVFNAELAAGVPMDNALVLSTADAWELYKIDVTDPTKLTKVDAEPSPPTLYETVTDGHTYITDIDWKNNQTTLLDLGTDPPTRGLTGDGLVLQVRRIR